MPVQKLMLPRGCTACSLDSILPVSGVSVVSTSQLLHTEKTIALLCTILNVRAQIKVQRLLLCHGDEAYVIFWVTAGLGMTNNINCILLSLQPSGQEVPITHVLTIVHTKETRISI